MTSPKICETDVSSFTFICVAKLYCYDCSITIAKSKYFAFIPFVKEGMSNNNVICFRQASQGFYCKYTKFTCCFFKENKKEYSKK